jgi:pimeloyl-ACP methyl ester carboxylesterase
VLAPADQLAHLRLACGIAGVDAPEVVLPEERDLVLGGLRLHCLDWARSPGRPSGAGAPPLLFLHGGCLTAHTWDLVCLALRNEFRCLALDQRGHGDSEWSPTLDYAPEAHVRDVEALVVHLGLERPVLVGQSMGGMNALAYAARPSAGLAGLVLVDVGPEVRWAGAARIADFAQGPAELDSVEDFVERARAFNPTRDPRLLRRSLLHNLRRLPDGRWTWKYDRRAISPERFAAMRGRLENMREHVRRVWCPTLVVRGADSDVFGARDAERLAAALPDGRVATVADAGHTVQGDNPRALAQLVREFARGL